ncbi:partitioning protein [Bradyrhizobium diazoefficiens USDA 110]|uniref:Partitioning protein n=1 Tax=Bradyrhizobium diazoefficiens (strain JCM 10833 / BCRC 13528 / IAM 13628 / NBRC 14792 / USDA 110) TaxID=224911 RepID=Q89W19_BRADU|nr:plasmid partitioning protein RepB C-terminal domain-containing protein [Bradyrhizobium diazoefficiens]AND86600.1 plasmid stablization protein ParB [Bradyrhizobium diazoefficiens USDA 110]QBP19821.1 chromosome partitioning protein ParB [Bradyrhizobium diazoefficiens]BAC46139.1 partitioning protein [Bradyrhizobium diazoefficiens USDA 110]BCF40401.1 chromosome partitioning protein ParB [Bradyrhizobium diazoefficiens]BCF66539.1 chromosome partitioning protein ParB [Bradyrhizobium diazoefficiens
MTTRNTTDGSGLEIKTIPINEIRILNPRARNQRNFQDIVESIAKVGLKRPITVSPCTSAEGPYRYDLVCGQGRIEAFLQLGQQEIPSIIIHAEESDCLVMSLVENCARRHHRAIDLLDEINTLRGRGYDEREIARKIGVSPDYVRMISTLLSKGEERLVHAVETGILPLNMAIEIARCDDNEVQRALTQAYTEKKLRGSKLVAVRRVIEQRQRRGKHLHGQSFGRPPSKRPLTSESMIRVYRQEADRQRLLIKKAEVTQNRLLFVVEAIRALREDTDFVRLLQAEDLAMMPSILQERLTARPNQ